MRSEWLTVISWLFFVVLLPGLSVFSPPELAFPGPPTCTSSKRFCDAVERFDPSSVPFLPEVRSGARALAVLAQSISEIPRLIRHSQHLFTSDNYDIFICFNDESVSETRVVDGVSVRFVDISAVWQQFPPGFDPSMVPRSEQPHGAVRHRQMCRFFWKTVFQLPETANVSSYMRIDADSCIANLSSSPFHLLEGGAVYVSNGWRYVAAAACRGLKDFVCDYVAYFNVTCKDPVRWRLAFEDSRVAHYVNNFELLDLNFWRRPDVQHFVSFVDASWGIYLDQWGDSPLRYLALTLFAELPQVVARPQEWDYEHPCGAIDAELKNISRPAVGGRSVTDQRKTRRRIAN